MNRRGFLAGVAALVASRRAGAKMARGSRRSPCTRAPCFGIDAWLPPAPRMERAAELLAMGAISKADAARLMGLP